MADFSDVDCAEVAPLLAMMAATDAWPAVRAARSWTLEQVAELRTTGPLLDVGCGPGTFGAGAREQGWSTVDMDRSAAMLAALRRSHGATPVALADVAGVPLQEGSVGVARCERVLQWSDDPDAGLAELCRVVAPSGVVAVTDTDWSTLVVAAPERWMSEVVAEAALGWVPHPTFAASMAQRLRASGASRLRTRVDRVELGGWDPDAADQCDGPPGLPLRSILAAITNERRDAAGQAFVAIADAARRGSFAASLSIRRVLADGVAAPAERQP